MTASDMQLSLSGPTGTRTKRGRVIAEQGCQQPSNPCQGNTSDAPYFRRASDASSRYLTVKRFGHYVIHARAPTTTVQQIEDTLFYPRASDPAVFTMSQRLPRTAHRMLATWQNMSDAYGTDCHSQTGILRYQRPSPTAMLIQLSNDMHLAVH